MTMDIKIGDVVYDIGEGKGDYGTVVGLYTTTYGSTRVVAYWDGKGEDHCGLGSFKVDEVDPDNVPESFTKNYFASLSLKDVSLLYKKVKATKLAKKMYPNAKEEEEGYLLVEGTC